MQEIIYRHTAKVFISDLILALFLVGFLTAIVHLLRMMSEELVLDSKNVRLKIGILSSHEIDVPLNRINSIAVRQGIMAKMLNYGSLIIYTGNDVSGIVFKQLNDPSGVKALIQSRMTESR